MSECSLKVVTCAASHILWLKYLDTQDYVSYNADNEKQALTNQFNICRTKRNITDYDRAVEISENEHAEPIE